MMPPRESPWEGVGYGGKRAGCFASRVLVYRSDGWKKLDVQQKPQRWQTVASFGTRSCLPPAKKERNNERTAAAFRVYLLRSPERLMPKNVIVASAREGQRFS